jgi:predicted AlkP superfamily pyrophosphatase or phosphodiesterase
MWQYRKTIVGIAAVLCCLGGYALFAIPVEVVVQPEGDGKGPPKLVVVVVFDQLRGDYLTKWQPLFVEGGFNRLMKDGAHFTQCHYPYAYTLTAAGHTSLLTGASPNKHGVIANDWYDRETGESVSSVTPPPEEKRNGFGPYRRKVESLGDVLMRVLRGARIASFSVKPRSAILLAGSNAQMVYWMDDAGQFETSPHYRALPHRWVRTFNNDRRAEKFLNKTWERFKPDLDYVKYSGPDDFEGEGTGYDQGVTFPHKFQMLDAKKPERYFEAVFNSPVGNDILFEFAKAGIVAENLGKGDATDLLCISFSSNDFVGHCWGPDSQEVLDITLRSDAMMQELLQFLDAKVGKGNYTIALSADHGVCPLPEWTAKQGGKAARVDPALLTSQAEMFLNEKFAGGAKIPWLLTPRKANPWIYFNQPVLKELKLDQKVVERALADWMAKQPGIHSAYTRSEMLADDAPKDPIALMVRKSFHPEGSGDVMAILAPNHLFSQAILSKNPEKIEAYRTTHGTPHPYDTHVPLIVMGPKVAPGPREQRVAPQAMASILAEVIGIPAPAAAEHSVPEGLWKK